MPSRNGDDRDGQAPRAQLANRCASPVATQSRRVLCLAEIANFLTLRRQLGRARSDRLILDVVMRVGQVLPDARLAIIGRSLVEIAFESDQPRVSEATLRALQQAFASAAEFEHEAYELAMTFGIATAAAVGSDDVRLVEEAEAALEAARRTQRPTVHDLDARPPTIDQRTLIHELPVALSADQLFLQFQPKIHLRRQAVVAVEALVRWDHPTRGLILPGDFIPSAEASRHIGPLTLWTLRRVIADQRVMALNGHDLQVYINISGRLLADAPFVEEACALVGDNGAKIGFEITETAVIREPDSAIANLERFVAAGIPIAIDDYGAGLSSLAYLKRLPATELKIDKLFVTQLTSSNRDPLIVRSTIDLAHALDMEVTAEGVENPATLALLTVMGCDMAQGYLIGRPVGFGALLQYLDEDHHLLATGEAQSPLAGLTTAWRRG